jgi:hypothetical protein
MPGDATILIVILCVIVGLSLTVLEASQRRQAAEREKWNEERKDLLDRIQAPSFAAYTHKVVQEKKAEKHEDERDDIEFVS